MNRLQAGKYPPPWETMAHRSSTGKRALEVLHLTLGDQWANLPQEVQEQILQKLPDLEKSLIDSSKSANKSEYIHWMDRISRTMTSGERVENLLLDFFRQLEQMMAAGKSDALFAILLEQIEDDKGLKTMRMLDKSSPFINPKHWQEFSKALNAFGTSLFYQSCLNQKGDQEVILARYVNHYQHEMDDLVKECIAKIRLPSGKGASVIDKFWLSTLALPSDYAPERCILVAYANTGDEIRLIPPQSATEEQRVLQFLRIAYNQINYRIRDLPKFLHAQRRVWIRDLAPSVLAHEAAASIQIITDSAIQANQALVDLMKARPDLQVSLSSAAKLGNNVLVGTTNLMRTFSTYLNLQRKGRIEQFPLETAFEEAWELCKQRLVGIEVAIDTETATRQIRTDRVLLTLVFANLLTNAARAIHEGTWPEGYSLQAKKMLLTVQEGDDGKLHLILANSGPPISIIQSGKIFVQGYSTYVDGHGQGLFVCRLICQHLGGNLLLTGCKEFGDEFNVAFDIFIDSNLISIGRDGDE